MYSFHFFTWYSFLNLPQPLRLFKPRSVFWCLNLAENLCPLPVCVFLLALVSVCVSSLGSLRAARGVCLNTHYAFWVLCWASGWLWTSFNSQDRIPRSILEPVWATPSIHSTRPFTLGIYLDYIFSLSYLHNQALGKDNAEKMSVGGGQGAQGFGFTALLLRPYSL